MSRVERLKFHPESFPSWPTRDLHNILGQIVTETELDPMQNSFTWDGTDLQGEAVSSGVYFYKIQSGTYSVSSKMIYMK